MNDLIVLESYFTPLFDLPSYDGDITVLPFKQLGISCLTPETGKPSEGSITLSADNQYISFSLTGKQDEAKSTLSFDLNSERRITYVHCSRGVYSYGDEFTIKASLIREGVVISEVGLKTFMLSGEANIPPDFNDYVDMRIEPFGGYSYLLPQDIMIDFGAFRNQRPSEGNIINFTLSGEGDIYHYDLNSEEWIKDGQSYQFEFDNDILMSSTVKITPRSSGILILKTEYIPSIPASNSPLIIYRTFGVRKPERTPWVKHKLDNVKHQYKKP